jgi:hypothetical protein
LAKSAGYKKEKFALTPFTRETIMPAWILGPNTGESPCVSLPFYSFSIDNQQSSIINPKGETYAVLY